AQNLAFSLVLRVSRHGNGARTTGCFLVEPVLELVVRVLVSSLLFAIIFAPAIGLDLLVKWLKDSLAVSDFLAGLLTGTKYIVASIDAFLYVVFMVRMGWIIVTNLIWGQPRHGEHQKSS